MCCSLRRPRRDGPALCPQALYALIDQELHGPDPHGRADSTAVVAELTDAYGVFPFVKGTRPQASNQHLIGYGGSYYNYAFTRCVSETLPGMSV